MRNCVIFTVVRLAGLLLLASCTSAAGIGHQTTQPSATRPVASGAVVTTTRAGDDAAGPARPAVSSAGLTTTRPGDEAAAPALPAASSAEVTSTMNAYFQTGSLRSFGPDGPRFDLPQSYYDYFAAHQQEAATFLEGKLTSTQGPVITNVYDFIIHMARIPATRDWALSKMKQAIESGEPIKYMVQPAYEEIMAGGE